MTKIPHANRLRVLARSNWVCEGCGLVPATEIHHRKYRSRGGTHDVSNLLHLCGWGNHTGCHGVAHTRAGELKGWSVRSGFDPSKVPVSLAVGLVLLNETDEYERFNAAETAEWIPLARYGLPT